MIINAVNFFVDNDFRISYHYIVVQTTNLFLPQKERDMMDWLIIIGFTVAGGICVILATLSFFIAAHLFIPLVQGLGELGPKKMIKECGGVLIMFCELVLLGAISLFALHWLNIWFCNS